MRSKKPSAGNRITNAFVQKGTDGPYTGKLEFLEMVRDLYLHTNNSWRTHNSGCNGTW